MSGGQSGRDQDAEQAEQAPDLSVRVSQATPHVLELKQHSGAFLELLRDILKSDLPYLLKKVGCFGNWAPSLALPQSRNRPKQEGASRQLSEACGVGARALNPLGPAELQQEVAAHQ